MVCWRVPLKAENRPPQHVELGGPGFYAAIVGSCGGLARPRRRTWPPLVTAHARAAAEMAGCRLGRRRSRRRAPNSAAPSTSSPLIDRQFEISALSGGSVGRLCGSGGRVWSGGRSLSLVCVFSGRLCVLGLWVSLVPERGFGLRTSSRLVVSLRLCLCVFVNTTPLLSPPPVLSFRSLVRSRFGSRNRGHGGVFSALGCGVTRVPPPLAVRCALFSVDGRVGCFSCLNGIGRSFCGASPGSGPASGPATGQRAGQGRRRRDDPKPETHGRCPG